MKEYSLTEAAKILNHRGGAYGLSLDLKFADDIPIKVEKRQNGRWKGLNELTVPVLQKYYEMKRAATL